MMRVVLIGGMAALGQELIEGQVRCACELSVIRDPGNVPNHLDLLETADVIVGWPLSPEIAAAAKRARLIQISGAGLDGIRFDLLRPGVTVANTFHHEIAISEHIVMAMLLHLKRPAEYDRRLREGNWWDSCIGGEKPNLPVLEGKTALLIGLGRIGLETAKRTKAFGVRNVGVSRNPRGKVENIDLWVGYDDWRSQLETADFVVPCCPLTSETEGLIGAAEFELMKPAACVINTARGKVIDEKALYEALRDRRIGGAAIDVWYDYPADVKDPRLPSQYPFHELDNVLMTPHVSGWSMRTVEGRMRDIAENISRVAEGRALLNVVFGGAQPKHSG